LALADDNRISIKEAYAIVEAALDKNGITSLERQDLRTIFSQSKSIDPAVRNEILTWLTRCDRLATRAPYTSASRNYGNVPNGWQGSEYDTGGAGRCAVKVAIALKAAGLSFSGYSWKYLWKKELPVNATELSQFLNAQLGAGEKQNRNSNGMNVRQGILFIAGGWDSPHGAPVGHITLWNGKKCEDGTSYDVQKGAASCLFWELRPSWLKS